MRSVAMLSMVASLVACGAPSIDDSLATDNIPLPERAPPRPDAGTDAAGLAPPPVPESTLTVTLTGAGAVTSTPSGVTCTGTTCTGSFARGSAVTLAAAPVPSSVFTGWSAACTGAAGCAIAMDADVAVGADFQSLDGAWTGTYTNTRVAQGCTFTNAGNLNVAFTSPAGAGLSSSGAVTGLELRAIPGCQLVGMTTGTSPVAPVALAGNTVTGTWNAAVQGGGGSLAFPFTAKVTSKTITGSWTCATCTGSFTLTKP